MSIIIGADIVPTDSNMDFFKKADACSLVGIDLMKLLQEADYRIFNLEVPLTDKKNPIEKNGPSLIAHPDSIRGLKALGVDLFTLANNHIMDQGRQGLESSIELLSRENISYVGAGLNIQLAQKPYYFEIRNKRYGVYACAEHEFSIAGENTPGANPFESMDSFDHVSQMKTSCDYAIVLYHGGKEHYRYPSPYLQRVCRKMIDKGADLIVCQHSHCIGCKEEYKGGTIIYGQGNFLFAMQDNEFWNSGVLVQLDDNNRVSYIPFRKHGGIIRMASREECNNILFEFEQRSMEIKDANIVKEKYKALAANNTDSYILFFLGLSNNVIFKAINKLSNQRLKRYVAKKAKQKLGLGMRNFIECEAHRELLLEGLQRRIIDDQ